MNLPHLSYAEFKVYSHLCLLRTVQTLQGIDKGLSNVPRSTRTKFLSQVMEGSELPVGVMAKSIHTSFKKSKSKTFSVHTIRRALESLKEVGLIRLQKVGYGYWAWMAAPLSDCEQFADLSFTGYNKLRVSLGTVMDTTSVSTKKTPARASETPTESLGVNELNDNYLQDDLDTGLDTHLDTGLDTYSYLIATDSGTQKVPLSVSEPIAHQSISDHQHNDAPTPRESSHQEEEMEPTEQDWEGVTGWESYAGKDAAPALDEPTHPEEEVSSPEVPSSPNWRVCPNHDQKVIELPPLVEPCIVVAPQPAPEVVPEAEDHDWDSVSGYGGLLETVVVSRRR